MQVVNNVKRYESIYVKRRLVQLEVDIFDIVASGLKQGQSKQQILAQAKQLIRSLSVQIELDQAEVNRTWSYTLNLYQNMDRRRLQLKKKTQQQQNHLIYMAIRAKIYDQSFIQDANQVVEHYEQRLKHNQLEDMLSTASSPFFLCSSHPKPAKDHAEWEGKMYYDRDWEMKLDNLLSSEDIRAIRAYIQNHDLHTVQWVTGDEGKIWLCTRPHCKHYFTPMPLDEVLHASTRSLLRKHGLYMPDQKPASRRLINYRYFYNRLKLLESLRKTVDCPQLRKDIRETQKLLDRHSK